MTDNISRQSLNNKSPIQSVETVSLFSQGKRRWPDMNESQLSDGCIPKKLCINQKGIGGNSSYTDRTDGSNLSTAMPSGQGDSTSKVPVVGTTAVHTHDIMHKDCSDLQSYNSRSGFPICTPVSVPRNSCGNSSDELVTLGNIIQTNPMTKDVSKGVSAARNLNTTPTCRVSPGVWGQVAVHACGSHGISRCATATPPGLRNTYFYCGSENAFQYSLISVFALLFYACPLLLY